MTVKIGDKAPDFALNSGDGKRVTLGDFKGKWLVLYFYPKDNTPGCTTQACTFRDELNGIKALGAAVVGVSADDADSHKRFAAGYDLNFPLLSDENNDVAEAYGVWKKKKMFGREYFGIERSTFLISPDGKIAHLWRKVSPKENVDEVVAKLKELNV